MRFLASLIVPTVTVYMPVCSSNISMMHLFNGVQVIWARSMASHQSKYASFTLVSLEMVVEGGFGPFSEGACPRLARHRTIIPHSLQILGSLKFLARFSQASAV